MRIGDCTSENEISAIASICIHFSTVLLLVYFLDERDHFELKNFPLVLLKQTLIILKLKNRLIKKLIREQKQFSIKYETKITHSRTRLH